ncbi:hypothetical protein [Flavobacterium beibuense]|uniref:hypothetical protein n=1 Tax=Flavobacterium beibuense TaxID=657326 RepID=UPI003A9256BD
MNTTITKESIDKIQAIFMHLQLVDGRGVQKYDPLEEHRAGIVIAKELTYGQEAKEVYCHAAKITPWLKRIWDKRKKEIPYQAFEIYIPEAAVWRLGFRV